MRLEVSGICGAQFYCPTCGLACKFEEMSWRHLNCFQSYSDHTAPVTRLEYPVHGVKRIQVLCEAYGSAFTLGFDQVALALVREISVTAVARQVGIINKCLCGVVLFYVHRMMARVAGSWVRAVGFDKTSAERGNRYITVFIGPDREEQIGLLVRLDKDWIQQFQRFFEARRGVTCRLNDGDEMANGTEALAPSIRQVRPACSRPTGISPHCL